MKYVFISVWAILLSTSCNNNSKSSASTVDSLPPLKQSEPLKNVKDFKAELLNANPNINNVQLQFQLDTFSIERTLDSTLGYAQLVDQLGSARSQAILSYLKLCDQMADSILKAMGKDSIVFVEERNAWHNYYFKAQTTISKTDDDEYLGLGSSYSTIIGQDLLQEVRHRAITIFTRFKRVRGISY